MTAASAVACLLVVGAAEHAAPPGGTARSDAATRSDAAGASRSHAAGRGPELTLELIMSDPEWMGAFPRRARWSPDSLSVHFEREPEGCDESVLVELLLPEGGERVVPDEELAAVPTRNRSVSRERGLAAWTRSGDVFVQRWPSGLPRRLTSTVERERDALVLTGGRVAYRRGDRFLATDPRDGVERTLADLRREDDPEEDEEADWLERQQRRLFDAVRQRRETRLERRQRDRERRAADPDAPPAPTYLGDDVAIDEASLSPSGRHLLLVLEPERDDDAKTCMPEWVTDSGDIEVRDVRAKVAAANAAPPGQRLVLLDLESGARHRLELDGLPGIDEDPFAELKAAARRRAEERADREGDEAEAASADDAGRAPRRWRSDRPGRRARARAASGAKARDEEGDEEALRDVRAWRIAWSRDGRRAAVMLRAIDNRDRWIAAVDAHAAEPRLEPLHRLADPAWINWRFNEMGWMPHGESLWFLSEESGWSHLWLRRLSEAAARQVTFGEHVVEDVTPTHDGRWLYFRSNRAHPGIFEVERVSPDTLERERITELGGLNRYALSPDEESLLVTHSAVDRPPELWVQPAVPAAPTRALTDSRSEPFRAIDWVEPQLVTYPSPGADRPVHARLYLPPEDAPASPAGAGRPAVVFVHGAGYLQDAHAGWSHYAREHRFHSLLAHRGFVVLAPDYRGSAGHGRAWRTAIHRDMGGPELADLRAGVELLVERHGVDPSRVGAYGGSYGGFLTLMALFREPDLFAAGAALRPVTDWAHYNHPYTSNILGTPELDPEAYRRSSPIEHAAGLRAPLLVAAPMLDDNVFFQDTVRLAQRLIELEKEDWEIAVYPVEPHGFRQPSSWLDEYRRILKLFETNLRSLR